MIASMPEVVRSESAPGTYRNCVTCDRRVHRDEMLDEWECRACHKEHLDKIQRRKLNQQLADQKKALGQAVNSMTTAIGNGKFLPSEPHVVYNAVLENFGGVEGFAKLYRELYDAARAPETGSLKVSADILKSVVVLSVEAQKTAPPPPNCNNMSDEELGEYTARLMQQKLEEIQELERIANAPAEPDPLPEDRLDVALLLMESKTEVRQASPQEVLP